VELGKKTVEPRLVCIRRVAGPGHRFQLLLELLGIGRKRFGRVLRFGEAHAISPLLALSASRAAGRCGPWLCRCGPKPVPLFVQAPAAPDCWSARARRGTR